jgi:hypothetical protein
VSQGWANLLGALTIDYRGTRYALGRTPDSYAIWELARGGSPVQTWPVTQEGWAQAWATYQSWEGPAALAQVVPGAEPPLRTAAWTRGRPIPLQPMRVGQILDGAFKLYRLHFGTLVGIVAFVLVPFHGVVLLSLLATLEFRPTFFGPAVLQPDPWVSGAAGLAQYLIVTPFLTAAIVRTAADAFLGYQTGVGTAYRAALPRIHSVLWVSILLALSAIPWFIPGYALLIGGAATRSVATASIGGLLILAGVVPAVLFILRFLLGPSAVMVENIRGVAALRRSWRLEKGLTAKALGTMLLVILLILAMAVVLLAILGVLVAVIAGDDGVEAARLVFVLNYLANVLLSLFTTPFVNLVIVLLYFDARIRKEGFDLEVMAQQIGAAPPAGA